MSPLTFYSVLQHYLDFGKGTKRKEVNPDALLYNNAVWPRGDPATVGKLSFQLFQPHIQSFSVSNTSRGLKNPVAALV